MRLIQLFRQTLDRVDYAGIGFPVDAREARLMVRLAGRGLLFERRQGSGQSGYSVPTVVNQALAGQLMLS